MQSISSCATHRLSTSLTKLIELLQVSSYPIKKHITEQITRITDNFNDEQLILDDVPSSCLSIIEKSEIQICALGLPVWELRPSFKSPIDSSSSSSQYTANLLNKHFK
jgi:hypothetical protein